MQFIKETHQEFSPSDNITGEKLLLHATRGLSQSNSVGVESHLMKTLRNISRLFGAGRVMIFKTTNNERNFSCTHEYHAEDLQSVKNHLQNLSFKDYVLWGRFASRRSPFPIQDTENIPDSYPIDKKLFLITSSKSFVQIPLLFSDKLRGFIAISHPQGGIEYKKTDLDLLISVSELINYMIMKLSSYQIVSTETENKTLFLPAQKEPENELKKTQKKTAKENNKTAAEKKDTSTELKDNGFLEFLDFGIAIYDYKKENFRYVNRKFASMLDFEIQYPLVTNKILSVFKKNGYDNKDFFSGKYESWSKDFTLYTNDRHLDGKVNAVSGKSQLIISLHDITPLTKYEELEKVFSKQLKTLSETAIELFSGKKENIFEFIGETIHKLISNSVVIVNEYKKDESLLQTRSVKGMGLSMNLISQLLGKHPLNKKYRIDVDSDSYKNVISTYLQEVKGGLAELSFGSISEPIARKIEKISKTSQVYACGLYVRGILYGTITIMLRSDSQMNNYIIETFARMVSHALHAQQMGKQLTQSRKLLTDAGRIARMGYWQYRFCDNTFIINKDFFNPTPNCNDKERNISIPLEVFLKKFVDSRDAGLIRSKFAEAAQNINNTSHAFDLEWTFIRENRPPLFVYTRAVVQKGGYILGITQDVSEIKKAEHQLWESESKFKNLVDQSLDSIIIIQDDGKITEWNPQTEKLTLIPSSSVIGKNLWDVELELIYKPEWGEKPSIELKEKLRRRFFQFFNLNKQSALLNREITIKNNIDEIKELSVTSFVFSANRRKFLCRISKDITLTKREREKQKEKEINQGAAKVKELFLDNMSHEMRTPLSGIIGMTEILMHSGLNGHQQELLSVVKESSDTLLELISNIHELSTIDANKIIIKEREFVFKHLLDKTLTMFKAVSLQKNIKMDLQNTAPDNLVLYGDDFRIQQVLTNLLANAIKFTPAGGEVTLEALTQRIGEDTVRLRLVVKDTGIGIKEEKTSILFEKFTQVDSSYTREHEGAGIGLYITRQIVEMMGGTIGVTSKHMKGSNFWVQLNLPSRNL